MLEEEADEQQAPAEQAEEARPLEAIVCPPCVCPSHSIHTQLYDPAQQHAFRAHGHVVHMFVQFRTSLRQFNVVGLASVALMEKYGEPVRSCGWRDASQGASYDSEQAPLLFGEVKIHHTKDENNLHHLAYEAVVVRCTFPDTVGAEGEGGYLFFNVTSGFSLSTTDVESEAVVAFHEKPENFDKTIFTDDGVQPDLKYEYAFCSSPIFGHPIAKRINEWLHYHHALFEGSVHYFMYDAGGLDAELSALFDPYQQAGRMTITDVQMQRNYESYWQNQVLVVNDCLYRSRLVAKWALHFDFEEYIHVAPPALLKDVLAPHFEKPWVSFGSIYFSLAYCAPETEANAGAWAVERLLFRLEWPTCYTEGPESQVCFGAAGKRKYLVNPRMVHAAAVHYIVEGESTGETLNTAVARINHYGGLAGTADDSPSLCKLVHDPAEIAEGQKLDEYWVKDDELAKQCLLAKKFMEALAEVLHLRYCCNRPEVKA
eukprot:SM000039S14548  [mRNA]  locus=s39:727571:730631:- [translate_table: standard]